MLLPHPKYKGSFIALSAPSFSSKLITSETWMTLELEAPPETTSEFLREVPLSNTAHALSQRGGRGAGLCLAWSHSCHAAQTAPSFASRHTPLLPGRVGPPALPHPVYGQQRVQPAPNTPCALSPEAAAAGCGHAAGHCCLCRHALHVAPKNWAALQLVMLICIALTARTLLA